VELGDLSLDRRIGAALRVIKMYPTLDVPQRHELLVVALWPDPTVTLPAALLPVVRPHATARERRAALDMVVRSHMSTVEVAARYAVTDRTVRRWVNDAAL
jgi:hypothetical protein